MSDPILDSEGKPKCYRLAHAGLEDKVKKLQSQLSTAQGQVEVLRVALEQVDEFCGPPKMSESVGTMHSRVRQIKEIISTALLVCIEELKNG